MKIVKMIILFSLALAGSAYASYETKIMRPWIGAQKAELVASWGYPSSANDIVKIDDTITVYSYRSSRSGGGWGNVPQDCVVSFTLENDVVTQARYEGRNCPKHER